MAEEAVAYGWKPVKGSALSGMFWGGIFRKPSENISL